MVQVYQPDLSVGDLKAALQRRGPDNLSIRKVFLRLRSTNSIEKDGSISLQHENRMLFEFSCLPPAIVLLNVQNLVFRSISELNFTLQMMKRIRKKIHVCGLKKL